MYEVLAVGSHKGYLYEHKMEATAMTTSHHKAPLHETTALTRGCALELPTLRGLDGFLCKRTQTSSNQCVA